MKHFLYDFEDVMAVSDFVLTKKRQNLIFVVVLFFFISFSFLKSWAASTSLLISIFFFWSRRWRRVWRNLWQGRFAFTIPQTTHWEWGFTDVNKFEIIINSQKILFWVLFQTYPTFQICFLGHRTTKTMNYIRLGVFFHKKVVEHFLVANPAIMSRLVLATSVRHNWNALALDKGLDLHRISKALLQCCSDSLVKAGIGDFDVFR